MRIHWQKIMSLLKFLREFRQSLPFRNSRLNFFERYLGRKKFASLPIVLQLELTNSCNLKCASCGHSYWNKKLNESRFIEQSTIEELDSIFPHLSELVFGGYGEPTLHPKFGEILDYFRVDEHLKISLITNGTLLQKWKPYLERLNTIILSMDGVGDIYESHRKIPFNKFVENLTELCTLRTSLVKGDKAWEGPFDIEINMVWNRFTHQNLSKAIKFLSNYPVSKLHLLPEKMYDSNRNPGGLFHLKDLHQIYMDIQQLKRDSEIEIVYPDFLRFELRCNQPFDMVFLLSNGELMACCSGVFHGHKHRFSLGRLQDFGGSFYRLWNQPSMQRYRKAILGKADYPEPCKNCAFRFVMDSSLRRNLDAVEVVDG